jgi:hypothetical protein
MNMEFEITEDSTMKNMEFEITITPTGPEAS